MDITLLSNSLLTTLESFSEIACLDGRVFGVETMCDSCNLDFNLCLRRRLLENLISNQGRVEREVGYTLTPRYHEQEIRWDGVPGRFQLEWPGISEINVVPFVETLVSGVSISPFVIEDAPVTDSGEGFCLVELDYRYIDNPNHAVIRDATTNAIYPHQEVPHYPRRNGDGNWLVPLGKPAVPPCTDIEVNIQHCKLMIVERTTPTCDGDVKIVRPGTDKIIPFAKPSVVDGSITRYFLRPWSLVDDAFEDETIDLAEGAEFYKLLTEVDFICESSEEALPIVTKVNCGCELTGTTEDTTLINVSILFAERGVIKIDYSEDATCLRYCSQPLKFKVYYKTDPDLLVNADSLLSLQEAIAYLTAAELPASSCGCTINEGFIADAQKTYAEYRINPMNGQVVANIKFNSLQGQLVFAEKLSKAYKFKKVTRL